MPFIIALRGVEELLVTLGAQFKKLEGLASQIELFDLNKSEAIDE